MSIIGGTATTLDQYPTVVAIVIDASLCTGTLIAPSWVLTAGHCVDPTVVGLSSQAEVTSAIRVHFGTIDLRQPGTVVRASETIKDPLFNKDRPGTSDIGLIKLATAVSGIDPSPINLTAAKAPVGTVVTVVGFGSTARGGQGASGVQLALDGRVSISCPSLGIGADTNLLCFSQADNKGTCLGDSGGPAFATIDGKRTVVGVTSFGDDECAEFGADTRVDIEEAFLSAHVPEIAGCQSDTDCPSHRTCFARQCIALPFSPTGIGTICTASSECESRQCTESTQDGKRCSIACTISDDSSCPDGFDCLLAANSQAACWPSTAAGCCDAGGAGGPAAMVLGSSVLALALRRRRR